MARGDNLRPYQWKPGQSGNPKGPPKGKRIVDWMREIRDEIVPSGAYKGMTFGEAMARAAFLKSLKGNMQAVEHVQERLDGKVPQKIELEGMSRMPGVTDAELIEKLKLGGQQGGDNPSSEPGGPGDGA